MKAVILFIFLFVSTTIVGQTSEKYVVEYCHSVYDTNTPRDPEWIRPENFYTLTRQAKHGKKAGQLEGMTVGNRDYWKATLASLKERYFTEKQLALFKEKEYNMIIYMVVDNVGNIKCFRLFASKGIRETLSTKQFDNFYNAIWKIKPPIEPRWSDKSNWGDEYFWSGTVQFFDSSKK